MQLCLFLFLRVDDPVAESPTSAGPATLIRFLARYFSQLRLVLAWLLSVTRAVWWELFYHIAPVYLLTIGLEKQSIGLVTSLGSAGLLTVVFWGWGGRRVGLRALLTKAFAFVGLLTVLVAATNGNPLLAACFLIVAAAATSIVDSCGNVPFLNAVRPHERSEMTTVYATYRDISRVASLGVYTLLLSIFPFTGIFIAGGGAMILLSLCARKLPRRLGIPKKDRERAPVSEFSP